MGQGEERILQCGVQSAIISMHLILHGPFPASAWATPPFPGWCMAMAALAQHGSKQKRPWARNPKTAKGGPNVADAACQNVHTERTSQHQAIVNQTWTLADQLDPLPPQRLMFVCLESRSND
jgi:hypothetical protein